jgi:uncharacterized membrane protein
MADASPQTSAQTIPSQFPHVAPDSPPAQATKQRIDSIDLLRGIVMVVMMLDHTRDFVHSGALLFDPTDLRQTTTAVFLTRWITHFCAPVFVFLAGTSIYLQFARGKPRTELSRFLITRGIWLVVLEFTLVRLGVFFNLDYSFLGVLQVIWVIGVSMIVMAALIHLPIKIIAIFGIAMILAHNLLDRFRLDSWRGPGTALPSLGAKLWMILHQPLEAFPVAGFPSPVVFVIYPLIPWVGVMAAGYALGVIYLKDAALRRKILLILGAVVTTLFLIIRAINVYGDPSRWSQQNTLWLTVLSFINTTKYPPSLLFLLMTLGPALIALALFESFRIPAHDRADGLVGRFLSALVTFGRVPLFFYLLQWPTVKLISIVLHWATGKPVGWLTESPFNLTTPPAGIGFRLWVVYACWILGVLLLYPLCKWFSTLKRRRRDWWLSYI